MNGTPLADQTRRTVLLIALAFAYTALNAAKPLVIDDALHVTYAAHFAQDPLDPYGFRYRDLIPANHILITPVFVYWLAAGMRVLGTEPFLWKLWLLPVSLIFVFSLHALIRRAANGLELPLTCMTVLSAAFLPSLNLMFDVPGVALGLLAIVCFIRACDSDSPTLTVLSGLVAGLAIETKYVGFLVPGVFLIYGLIFGQLRRSLLCAALAVIVFLSWEAFTAWRYGESHFVHAFYARPPLTSGKLLMLVPFIGILGGVAAPIGLLVLLATTRRTWPVTLAGGLFIAGLVLLAAVPADLAVLWADVDTGKPRLTLNNLVMGSSGLFVLVSIALIYRGLRPRRGGAGQSGAESGPGSGNDRRWDWFLLGWLALEIVGAFVLSPFPAVRRVFGVIIVLTLLAGRSAARADVHRTHAAAFQAVVAGSVCLGAVYYATDMVEAYAERSAVEQASAWIRQQDPEAIIWFDGPISALYFAERAGMRYLSAAEGRTASGDWLVLDTRLGDPARIAREAGFTYVTDRTVADAFPFSTVPAFYAGAAPLRHHEGPRRRLLAHRRP